MPGQPPDQKIQSPYSFLPNSKKRNYIIFGTVVLLVILVSFFITFKRVPIVSQIDIPLVSSCQPNIERTTNRKTGIIGIQNSDGSFTNITLYKSGENNIIRNYHVNDTPGRLKLGNLSLRGGRVINIDKKNKVLTADVGDENKMIIQITQDQIINVKKKESLYGHPTSESFINNAILCHIQDGDVIGIAINESQIKLYDKPLVVPVIEIVQ